MLLVGTVGRWAGLEDTHYIDGPCYNSDNQYYGMVGQWFNLDCGTLFKKNSALVGRWAGLEDTHSLKGLWYDRHNQDYGMDGQWFNLDCSNLFKKFYSGGQVGLFRRHPLSKGTVV